MVLTLIGGVHALGAEQSVGQRPRESPLGGGGEAGREEEAGAEEGDEVATLAEGRRVFALLREELPPARAAKLAAAITGAPRKQLYADESTRTE